MLRMIFIVAALLVAGAAVAEDLVAAKDLCNQHRRQLYPPPTPPATSQYEPEFAEACDALNVRIDAANTGAAAAKRATDLQKLQSLTGQ